MNKRELINKIAAELGLKKKEARQLLDDTTNELFGLLTAGKDVSIPEFGSFVVSELKKRRGFNPLIEKWMMLPPKRRAQFKPSTTLKNRIN